MNIDNDSNNGLADLIADLEVVYQDNGFDSVISRYPPNNIPIIFFQFKILKS